MVALKTERRAYLWRIEPHASPKYAPITVALDEIIDILKVAYDNNIARIYLTDGGRLVDEGAAPGNIDPKNCVYIADFKDHSDKNFITILINRGDPDPANPSFIKPRLNEVRNIYPEREETQGWSAHLVIAKDMESSSGRYRAAYERMQHVSSGLIELLFRTLLDKHTVANPKYVYDKPTKTKRKTVIEKRPYKLRLSVSKVPSEQIKKDISRGELTWVNLIDTSESYEGPGAPNQIKSVKRQLEIKPKINDPTKIQEWIEKLIPWSRTQGYNEIQFRVDNLPGDTGTQPRFSLEQEDAMEALYARFQRLTGFDEFLETCYANINEKIEEKMVELLEDDEQW